MYLLVKPEVAKHGAELACRPDRPLLGQLACLLHKLDITEAIVDIWPSLLTSMHSFARSNAHWLIE